MPRPWPRWRFSSWSPASSRWSPPWREAHPDPGLPALLALGVTLPALWIAARFAGRVPRVPRTPDREYPRWRDLSIGWVEAGWLVVLALVSLQLRRVYGVPFWPAYVGSVGVVALLALFATAGDEG
jgi:hypothetical protein